MTMLVNDDAEIFHNCNLSIGKENLWQHFFSSSMTSILWIRFFMSIFIQSHSIFWFLKPHIDLMIKVKNSNERCANIQVCDIVFFIFFGGVWIASIRCEYRQSIFTELIIYPEISMNTTHHQQGTQNGLFWTELSETKHAARIGSFIR